IAAKLISPERHVLCFAGDGDAQMTGQEMATATQEGALPNILVLDNGGFGTIQTHQARDFPGRVSGTELVNPDFVKWAEACGFEGLRLNQSADIARIAHRLSTEQGLLVTVEDYA
ncbi:MAG: thiamine pyrophosphate-dependent enzyme, partial [Pseudomonadota bacterium]